MGVASMEAVVAAVTSQGAAIFQVEVCAAEDSRAVPSPAHARARRWAAAPIRVSAADSTRGVPRARRRYMAARSSMTTVRSHGPPQVRISAQALRRGTLEQRRRTLITPLPMASGTPLPKRGAQPAQWARLAPLATQGLAILPGRTEARPMPLVRELPRYPPG